MKTYFITGSSGFIGSNLAKRILNEEDNVLVIGLDNMNNYYDVKIKEWRLAQLNKFDNFKFIKGDLADKETVLEMMAEFEQTQSAHDGGFWDAESFDYEEWLETNLNKEMGIGLPENRVPSIQFVLFDDSGHALGFLNLRLRLNEGLLNYAGHIGYSIRPSERGKGYAKEALHQGLQVAKEKNIHRALVTCSTENPASRAVILANGGQFEDVRNGTERYWIEVE